MPVIRDTTNIEKVYLPSYDTDASGTAVAEDERAWVMFDRGPARIADTLNAEAEMPAGTIGALTLVGRIKDWNLTDSTGEVLPINLDNVSKLVRQDSSVLMELLPDADTGGLSDEEKKPLSSTSTQSIQVKSL